MNITVIGGGYVGLVTGSCLAHFGHNVTIIEIDQKKAQIVNSGHSPLHEPGLEEILQQYIGKTLQIKTDYSELEKSNIIFLCVGTPQKQDGYPDLSYVISACKMIGSALKNRQSYCCIVVKSTVPPGTTEKIIRPEILKTSGKSDIDIGFVMNPEFLREGRAINDFMHPDRIIIGSNNQRDEHYIGEIYRCIQAPIINTNFSAAEMIKYVSNAFLATKISFSNEIGNICKKTGIDVYDVMKGVGLDTRIGPLFLNSGIGFGGSCFPKDITALITFAKDLGEDPVLLQSVLEINEKQPLRIVALLEKKLGSLQKKRVTILGLAFKDNTDDIRESRTIPVIRELLRKGADIVAYDPAANSNMQKIFPDITYCVSAADALTNSDGCLVMTEWPEFSRLDKEFDRMSHRIIIEGRRLLNCKDVDGICW